MSSKFQQSRTKHPKQFEPLFTPTSKLQAMNQILHFDKLQHKITPNEKCCISVPLTHTQQQFSYTKKSPNTKQPENKQTNKQKKPETKKFKKK